MTALNLYTKERDRMDSITKLEFESKSKEKAADLKFQRDLAMKSFEANLDAEMKGGVYDIDSE